MVGESVCVSMTEGSNSSDSVVLVGAGFFFYAAPVLHFPMLS